MVEEMNIDDFRNSGLLWFINQQLHVFGVALVVDVDDEGKAIRMYPGRCKFRGFSEESNDRGYKRISKYMVEHAEELLKDCECEE